MNSEVIMNAIIQDAEVRLDRGVFLSAWLMLDYGGSSQGFGGYVLGGVPSVPAGEHWDQPNFAADFIVRCMMAAGVESWNECVGKTIRVRKSDKFGSIIAIGHIVKDDLWYNPKESANAMKFKFEQREQGAAK